MITADDRIANVIERWPFLKERLVARNPKIANLSNPIVFRTVGRFARLRDVARVSGEDLAELLAFLNAAAAEGEPPS